MIAQLEGQVTWVGSDTLVLRVQGVGYLVSGTASVLQEASQQKTLSLW
ncbi:MAG: OB-fold domain-containing protein, partial [Holosporales bacterium]